MSGERKTAEHRKLQEEIRSYLIGATALRVSVCERVADDVAELAMKRLERSEFGQILAGLKARGVITQEDVERLERDGLKEVADA